MITAGLRTKLEKAFAPEMLAIENESHRHAGHLGDDGGHTHFRVKIVSSSFDGKSRVERHRMIYTALAEDMAGGIHALAIDAAMTPGEARG